MVLETIVKNVLTKTEQDGHWLPIISKTLLGSILAADGLVNNSLVSLIPSMIISPIGSIIINIALDNNSNIMKNLVFLGSIISISILVGFFYTHLTMKYSTDKFPTDSMISRTKINGLISTTIIASASIIAFYYASKTDDKPLLIAIGIATSLLPPLVNIGCLMRISFNKKISNTKYIISFGIFMINFLSLLGGVWSLENIGIEGTMVFIFITLTSMGSIMYSGGF